MRFWASAEVYGDALQGSEAIRSKVEPHLNDSIAASNLKSLDCMIRYVPIIMPVDMQDDYRERSRLSVKHRTYDCSPHLDYDTFVEGSFEDQLSEYLRGITTAVVNLRHLGATPRQTKRFAEIIGNSVIEL